MSVPDLLVPYLQRFAPYAVQDGQEAGLERVLEHIRSLIKLLVGFFHSFSCGIYGTLIDQTGENRLAGTRVYFLPEAFHLLSALLTRHTAIPFYLSSPLSAAFHFSDSKFSLSFLAPLFF